MVNMELELWNWAKLYQRYNIPAKDAMSHAVNALAIYSVCIRYGYTPNIVIDVSELPSMVVADLKSEDSRRINRANKAIDMVVSRQFSRSFVSSCPDDIDATTRVIDILPRFLAARWSLDAQEFKVKIARLARMDDDGFFLILYGLRMLRPKLILDNFFYTNKVYGRQVAFLHMVSHRSPLIIVNTKAHQLVGHQFNLLLYAASHFRQLSIQRAELSKLTMSDINRFIKCLLENKHLVELDLRYNHLDVWAKDKDYPEKLEALNQLVRHKTLRYLNLSHNHLDSVGEEGKQVLRLAVLSATNGGQYRFLHLHPLINRSIFPAIYHALFGPEHVKSTGHHAKSGDNSAEKIRYPFEP